MSLTTALQAARPGDLYWMSEGTYSGVFTLTRPGTPDNPIVFRARPGQRVTIEGKLAVKAAHNWIWGLEITDPDAKGITGESGSIFVGAPGAHLINNIIHDTWDCGIGGWSTGAGHVYYGNIVYKVGQHEDASKRCYPIYTQNDFSQFGYKHIVQNMFLDVRSDVGGPGYNFHAYTEQGRVSGFYLAKNILSNGRFLIGGFGVPADNEIVIENYFYNHSVEFGYRRPTQVEFRNNYLGRSPLSTLWFWGDGETRYSQTRPSVYTGNEIYFPPGEVHVMFRTSAYQGDERCEGCPRIRADDVFDDNTYSQPFRASFFANGTQRDSLNFDAWKDATAQAGNGFDVHSAIVPGPLANRIVLLANEYEPGRAHLVVYNWTGAASISVDLSPVVKSGSRFKIVPAKDVFGTPVISGLYTGPVNVPTKGMEFLAFVVVTNAETRRGPSPPRSRSVPPTNP